MAEALYRKYRPQVFGDVVGQDHIERTIRNAIEKDKVSHAYLFTGPRGTGKTTTARLLAKALLCEHGPTPTPDGTCEDCRLIAEGNHPDVYELDAASRTGVDNVREEIIGRVQFAPTRGRYKVYIIDEVHMLTVAAFNALLKTLEEPPSHVVFILCTTDPQKVPDTIHSRCQRFDFHRISVDAIVARLGAICVEEGVEFEPEALELIAHRAEGGMRNALTSLEQLIAFGEGKVTLGTAERMLGSLDIDEMSDLMAAIGRSDAAACFTWVANFVETGADLAQFTRDLAEHVRNLYLVTLTGADIELGVPSLSRKALEGQARLFGPDRLTNMLTVLGDLSLELKSSSNPRLSFEIALTRLIRPESDLTLQSLAQRVEQLERQLANLNALPAASAAGEPVATAQPVAAQAAPAAMPAPAPAPRPAAPQSAVPQAPAASMSGSASTPAPVDVEAAPANIDLSNPAALQRFWHSVTKTLRKENPARGVLFMNAKIAYASGVVQISFTKANAFAYNAARMPEVQRLLAQTIVQVAGGSVPFQLSLQGGETTPIQQAAPRPAAAPAPRPAAPAPQPAPSPAPASASTPAPALAASAAQPAPVSPQPAPAQRPAASTPQPSAPIPQRPAAPAPQRPAAPAPQRPAAPRPSVPAPSAPFYDDDQVPLDAYDGFAPDDDGYYDEPGFATTPRQASKPASHPVPAPTPRAAAAPTPRPAAPAPAPVPAPAPRPAQASVPRPATPAPVPQPATPAADEPAASDEADRIRQLLFDSYGDGLQIEELDG